MAERVKLLPIAEAAAELGITPKTVRRWAKAERVTLYRRGPRGRNNAGPLTYVDVDELRRAQRDQDRLRAVK